MIITACCLHATYFGEGAEAARMGGREAPRSRVPQRWPDQMLAETERRWCIPKSR